MSGKRSKRIRKVAKEISKRVGCGEEVAEKMVKRFYDRVVVDIERGRRDVDGGRGQAAKGSEVSS